MELVPAQFLEPKSLGISNAGSRTLQGKCEVPQKPMLRVDISNKMCTQILGVGTGTGQAVNASTILHTI
uniref:Uncharacterized protein n=1 Tax=Glossina palpalis gambiensis TaxID=67801 RepID=A0A1B0BL70_9MUSC